MNPNKDQRPESFNLVASQLQEKIVDACQKCRRKRMKDVACGALYALCIIAFVS